MTTYNQDIVAWAWEQAGFIRAGRLTAEKETGLECFPASCPWHIDQVLADDWLPEEK